MTDIKIDVGIAGRGDVKATLNGIKSDLKAFKRESDRLTQLQVKADKQLFGGLASLGKVGYLAERQRHTEKLRNIAREERAQISAANRAARAELVAKRRADAVFGRRVSSASSVVTGSIQNRVGNAVNTIGRTALYGGTALLAAGVRSEATVNGGVADIANNATAAGDKRGRQVIFDSIKRQVNSASSLTGIDRNDIVGGIISGSQKTGDVSFFESQTDFLAKLAKTSGSDFKDLSESAALAYGEFIKTMSKTDAIDATRNSLLALFKQTSIGSVEFKDLSKGLGQIIAVGSKFSGSPTSKLATFGALTQIANTQINSPEEAVTAIRNIPNDIQKHSGRFKKLGVNVFEKDGLTLRPVDNIITDTFKATKGRLDKQGGLFNIRADKALNPLRQAFVEGSGGKTDKASLEKGAESVRELIARFTSLSQTTAELDTSFNFRASQADAKFASIWERTKIALGDKFLPVLESQVIPILSDKFLPALVEAAPALAELATTVLKFVADNPFGAVATLIGVGIAKDIAAAGIGAALRGTFTAILGGEAAVIAGGASVGIGAALGAPVVALALAGALAYGLSQLIPTSDTLAKQVTNYDREQKRARALKNDAGKPISWTELPSLSGWQGNTPIAPGMSFPITNQSYLDKNGGTATPTQAINGETLNGVKLNSGIDELAKAIRENTAATNANSRGGTMSPGSTTIRYDIPLTPR